MAKNTTTDETPVEDKQVNTIPEYKENTIIGMDEDDLTARDVLEFYFDAEGLVRYHLKDLNGHILCDSAQGYSEKEAAYHSARRITNRALFFAVYTDTNYESQSFVLAKWVTE